MIRPADGSRIERTWVGASGSRMVEMAFDSDVEDIGTPVWRISASIKVFVNDKDAQLFEDATRRGTIPAPLFYYIRTYGGRGESGFDNGYRFGIEFRDFMGRSRLDTLESLLENLPEAVYNVLESLLKWVDEE